MRFALIATTAAAVAAVPLAAQVSGPQMSSEQFLAAVRCAAYQDVTLSSDDLGGLKMQLNAEARRQPSQTAAIANAEIGAIARQALLASTPDQAVAMRREGALACSNAVMAAGSQQARG